MTAEHTGADGSDNQGRFELNPVDPAIFEDEDSSSTRYSSFVFLQPEEQAAWQSQIDSEYFSLFPALEDIKEYNLALADVVTDALDSPGSADDREQARFHINEIKQAILDNTQVALTDMLEFMRPESDDNDEYVGGYIKYATDMIYDQAMDRVAGLGEAIGNAGLRPVRHKKLKRMISEMVLEAYDEDDMPDILTDVCESLINDEIDYIAGVLQEAYHRHDIERLATNAERTANDTAKLVEIMGRIADRLDSQDKDN